MPWRAYAVAAAIAVGVAGIGGLATDLGPWYRGLLQPAWKPPDIVFGPVWTLLYTLTAWAGARAWWHARPAVQADEAAAQAGRRRQRRLLFGVLLNALLTVLWSVLVFKAQLHRCGPPGGALAAALPGLGVVCCHRQCRGLAAEPAGAGRLKGLG